LSANQYFFADPDGGYAVDILSDSEALLRSADCILFQFFNFLNTSSDKRNAFDC
jgi:hypothetical protein